MSQHDFDIANQGFPATRADINNALKAAVSNSAGTSAPSTTYAYQFWYDSTNNIIKLRNGDNDAWINVATVDQTNDLISITHTGMLDLVDDDGSASIRFQAPSTVTSTTTFTLPDGDGDSGQTLVTNGSGTLAWAAPYGNRNMVVNGSMVISQRGTSTTSTSDGYHTVDRIYFETSQLDNYAHTMSQSTEAPDGFANSFKIDVTTAETAIATDEFLRVMYRIEAQDCQQLGFGTSSAQKTTLSFYVRSAVTGTYAVSMYQFDGNRIIGGTYTINSADTWERKTITFDGDVSGTINNDNGAGLQLSFMLSSGTDYTSGDNTSWSAYTAAKLGYGHTANVAGSTSNDWHITGVQLEVGSVATDFDHSESYGETLAKCQRYFYRWNSENLYGNLSVGASINSTKARGLHYIPTEMRTQPSFSSNGSFRVSEFSGSAFSTTSINITRGHKRTPYMNFNVSSGLTQGKGAELGADNDDDAFCDFDAEL